MKLIYDKKFMLAGLDSNRSREHLRNQLNLPFFEFKKTPFSENSSDMFAGNSFMFTYDLKNNLKEIEIYNNVEFYFYDEKIEKSNFLEVKKILDKLKIEYKILETSIITNDKSIEFYFPDLDEDGNLCQLESILLKAINYD